MGKGYAENLLQSMSWNLPTASNNRNRLLSLALIILPFFIAIAIGCVVYLRKQRRKLIQSQLKLQQAQEEVGEIHAK